LELQNDPVAAISLFELNSTSALHPALHLTNNARFRLGYWYLSLRAAVCYKKLL